MCCFFNFQDDVNSVRESTTGSEKKVKRHLERESPDVEHRGKDKKHSHKRQKINKKRPASTSSSLRSDFSQSDDSDEEMAVCPAERCQLPEGDEVRITSVRFTAEPRYLFLCRGGFAFHFRETLFKLRVTIRCFLCCEFIKFSSGGRLWWSDFINIKRLD